MARKPPALPDVFAKPGAAPARGTAIEDLPEPAEAIEDLLPPPEPEPAPPPAADPWRAPIATRQAAARSGLVLAVVALAVALTAPFWEDYALEALGIRTPIGRAAEQSMMAVQQLERRTDDITQRLAAATTQMTGQQAALTAAMRRADAAAALLRTMALVRLSETLRRPMPFASELAVVRANGTDLGEVKPLLDQIEPYADTGIPGTAQLREEFRALLERVSHGGAASWVSNLTAWTHLRSAQPAPADPSLQALQNAAARLADIDLPGAVEQVRQVDDNDRPVFANWLEDAQARVAADKLAERVNDLVTKTLRTPGAK
jgi:hypothetical protein